MAWALHALGALVPQSLGAALGALVPQSLRAALGALVPQSLGATLGALVPQSLGAALGAAAWALTPMCPGGRNPALRCPDPDPSAPTCLSGTELRRALWGS